METTTVASKVVASKSNRRTQETHVEEAGYLFESKTQNYKVFASQTKRGKFKKVTKLCICIQKGIGSSLKNWSRERDI